MSVGAVTLNENPLKYDMAKSPEMMNIPSLLLLLENWTLCCVTLRFI